jgi:hypothetical protein
MLHRNVSDEFFNGLVIPNIEFMRGDPAGINAEQFDGILEPCTVPVDENKMAAACFCKFLENERVRIARTKETLVRTFAQAWPIPLAAPIANEFVSVCR